MTNSKPSQSRLGNNLRASQGWVVAALVMAGLLTASPVQRTLPYFEGANGLAFALRKLPVTASFMHTAAHPDDEDNPLLVGLSRGRGIRSALFTLTRGDGGQNEIGPELFEALGIIRTEELMSMHRYDGVQQYFTDAYEFGYSFSVQETLEKWGREAILEQMVRVIRTFRPTVIVSLPRTGEGGGQHHQASAILTAEAYRAAADPNRFPHQLEQGLRPWLARKLYERQRWSDDEEDQEEIENALRMETGQFDPLFGRTWAQIGSESRSLHRCQGMGQIVPPAGERFSLWRIVDSAMPVDEAETDLFDGIDTSLYAIAEPAAGQLGQAPFLIPALGQLQSAADAAVNAFDVRRPDASSPALERGLSQVRRLRNEVASSDLTTVARAEIEFLLRNKERDFAEALALARGVTVEAFSQDGLVVPGQTFEFTVTIGNGGSQALPLETVSLLLPDGWQAEPFVKKDEEPPADLIPAGRTQNRHFRVTVASDTKLTQPYWKRTDPRAYRYEILDPTQAGKPWSDPDVRVRVGYRSGEISSQIVSPVEYRYPGPWVGGEQRHDVMVVPEVSIRVEPSVNVLPLEQSARGVRVRVSALYNGTGKTQGSVRLELPDGWTADPSSAALEFERTGQSLAHTFLIRPPSGIPEGSFQASAVGRFGGREYRQGYQVIDYDHIRRRHLYHPAQARLETVDVEIAPNLRVGYIEGVGDEVAEALEQLGVDFETLESDDLAFGDLSRFDTIVTGVRAYLVREDLKAYNSRLLEWVKQGGVLIVQYNKFEFNRRFRGDSPYAPYPAKVGRGRVTDENAPVEVLLPDHPVFQNPNRIEPRDWENWVQERGLYYLGEKSDQYRDLLSMSDPFEYNKGEKLGSLVEADYGKGQWIYVGIGLWRQLPAGVPGAYRLLANLISLPHTRTQEPGAAGAGASASKQP